MSDVTTVLPNGTVCAGARESHESHRSNKTLSCESDDVQNLQDAQTAPRSMRYWKEHHPTRYEQLQRVRSTLAKIAEDTRTPVEVIIKPQIIRNLCWIENIREVDISEFLLEQGARPWQASLIAESVTRAIM